MFERVKTLYFARYFKLVCDSQIFYCQRDVFARDTYTWLVELADTLVLGTNAFWRTGSTPVSRTKIIAFFHRSEYTSRFCEIWIKFFFNIFFRLFWKKYISFYFFGGWHYPAAFMDILWLGFTEKGWFSIAGRFLLKILVQHCG